MFYRSSKVYFDSDGDAAYAVALYEGDSAVLLEADSALHIGRQY